MTKGEDSHSEIAHVRQSDGIDVIFDQKTSASPPSRSPSKSKGVSKRSSGSGRHRGRSNRRGGHRSKSRSRSSSHRRSRSHPRCHRPSSRCRCDNHRRQGRGCGSPPRRHKAHSGSPSPSRHSRNRRNKPSSRPSSRRAVSRFSQSPPSNHRSSSGSGSSEHSVNLSIDDKGKPTKAAKANAPTIVGVEKLELPELVKPIQSELPVESKQVLRETWVRQDPEKTPSESDEESDDMFSRRMSPKRKTISFSINNSVLKPTATAPSGAKVTSRMDSYESRKPYGNWKPVKAGHAARARKHALAGSP